MKKTLRRLLPGALCLLALSTLSPAQETATAPDMQSQAPAGLPSDPAWGFWPKMPKGWLQTHEGLLNRRKQGGIEVLFLGDSLTAGWGKDGSPVWTADYDALKAANFGIGGDTTRQILWRIDKGELDGLKPKVVVLMIGVNNIFVNNGTDEEIAKGVEDVIKKIQAKTPDSIILLHSVLPLELERFDKRVLTLNPLLAKLAGEKVQWVDLTPSFRGADGKYVRELYASDGTHLRVKGYEAWAKVLTPKLKELLEPK